MRIESGTKAHAKFSASGSERWLECPGSIALSAKAPKQDESRYAMEGTDAHTCLETIMKNGDKVLSAVKMLQKKFPQTMIEHGFETYNHIVELMPKGSKLLCETKVDLGFVEKGMFGTVDAAIVELFGILWVIDYKYGAGRLVNPQGNSQGIYYALGIAHEYNYNFEFVRICIAQPRIVHKDGFFRTWDISISELIKWRDKFKNGVAECKDPFATLKKGRWCFFCPAQEICPLVNDKNFDHAQKVFDEI